MNKINLLKIFINIVLTIITIIFFMFVLHLLEEWCNPFSLFLGLNLDSPTATLLGAFLTGIIAYFAIYETSKLDRETRIYEYKVKFFYEKLIYIYNNINLSLKADEYFFSDMQSTTNTTYCKIMCIVFELKKYNNVINELIVLNSSLTKILKSLSEINNIYINMYEFLGAKILRFYHLKDEERNEIFPFFKIQNDMISIDILNFVQFYISKNNLQSKKIKSYKTQISKYAQNILKEFSFNKQKYYQGKFGV